MAYLTDRALASGVTLSDLLHIVITGDTSQNPDGSSYKATIQQVGDALSGSSFNTYVFSGNADVATSTLTFLNNDGGTFTVTNSAALFSDNDINVTGGTYNPSNGCVTFITNSGTTFDVCGFLTGFTDTYVTGGTYSAGTATFTNSSGGTFDVTGFTSTDTNFANTDLTFDGNRAHDTNGFNYQLTSDGGLFAEGWQTLSQFDSSIGWGGQYIYTNSDDIRFYILNNETVRINNSGNVGIGTTSPSEKLEVSGNTKISGSLNIGNILGNTPIGNLGFDSSGNVVTGTTGSVSDIFVTGGTFDNNTDTITFTNTSGGTFDVTGITDTFVIAGTFNDTTNTLSLLRNDGNFVNVTGVTDTFTGNTSGTCITDLFVSNIHSCSPLNINPLDEGNVYFGSTSGVTIDLTNNRVGINNDNPEYRLDISGTTGRLFYDGDTDRNAYRQSQIFNQGPSTGITAISIFSDGAGNGLEMFSIGTGVTNSVFWRFAGEPGDVALYATGAANNLNIMNNVGSGTKDNIRFYAGSSGVLSGNTSAMHIQGSGSTKGYIGINNENPQFTLDVAGETRLSGSGQNILTVIGSGDTQPLFTVQGSSGELFSVTDSLVGSLFSVNDISGLPILEVFDDDTIHMGNYQAPSLNTTVLLNPGTGLSDVYSIPVSAYTGAFFDYTVLNSTGARAGNIMSIFSGSTVEFSETTTNDIGSTSDVTFTMSNDGSNATLQVSATTTGWEVKTIVRSI